MSVSEPARERPSGAGAVPATESEADRDRERRADELAMLDRSLDRLRRAGELRDFDPRARQTIHAPLARAVSRIGELVGFEVPATTGSRGRGLDPVAGLARASGVTLRRVALEGDWTTGFVHPLLGFASTPGSDPLDTPVVLLPPTGRRPARVWDPATETTSGLVPGGLARNAFEFTPPLDAQQARSYRGIARFTFAGVRSEVVTILVVALVVAGLGVLSPIATNHAFGTLVPEGATSQLWTLGAGLVGVALVIWVFTVVQGLAVTRASLRAEQRLQPAVWARVLSLPTGFFRRFQSGELTMRILGVDQLRQVVSTSSVSVVLTAAFSFVNVIVMFAIDPVLGLVGTVVLVLVAAATVGFTRVLVRNTSEIVRQGRENNANITDILEGLSAIRTAAAERRFFALHAERVRRKVVVQARQVRVSIWLQVFYAALVTGVPAIFITAIFLWGFDPNTGRAEISGATYISFVTAFNLVLSALLGLSSLVPTMATAPETLRAMGPIFDTDPEDDMVRRDPGPLSGRIDVQDVTFQYAEGSRMVLQGCSLHAEPGESIALVGTSGSGKSTLLRLLLGFESPVSGTVAYDDHDLEEVDLASVRSQLGVVLQQSRPTGGSVLSNIIGARPLTTDDAWQALEAAGLADDVRAMPMGLQTHVAPDGSTMSGGQLQRLMIARALVGRPSVLILDEATSALDEATQDEVSHSIEALGITRIAVAHRLSTIRSADRIYVIDDGVVAEQGTFDELMATGGVFAGLARRQMV